MKYLLIFLVALLVAWSWRSSRSAAAREARSKEADGPDALHMLRCHQCNVHVPASESIAGREGNYCSTAHLRQAET